MNIKLTTLEVMERMKEALRAAKLEASTDTARANISEAEASIGKIAEQIGAVTDASSKTAADKANKIIGDLEVAVSDYISGNHSSPEARKKLNEALTEATGWITVKPTKWAREAKESDVKTVDTMSKTILSKSKVFAAQSSIADALELINGKLASSKGQTDKVDGIRAQRKAEREKMQGLEDDKQQVIADYQAGVLDSVEAKERILEIQKQISRCEERIEGYTIKIDQLGDVAEANREKLEELQTIIDNANFFADNSSVIVEIAKAIDFRAINAFISGVSTDVVISSIVNMDTVANIIAKQMKISAEEAKAKLKQGRSFSTHKSKNEVSLEEQVLQSNKRKQDADNFMQDLIAGSAGKPKPKVEIPTGGSGTIKISAGEEDI